MYQGVIYRRPDNIKRRSFRSQADGIATRDNPTEWNRLLHPTKPFNTQQSGDVNRLLPEVIVVVVDEVVYGKIVEEVVLF